MRKSENTNRRKSVTFTDNTPDQFEYEPSLDQQNSSKVEKGVNLNEAIDKIKEE